MASTARELTGQVGVGLGAPAKKPTLLERLLIGPGSAVLCLGYPEMTDLEALPKRLGPPGGFDVVQIRDPLVVLSRLRRRQLLRRAMEMTKPGGWIVSREQRSVLDPSPRTAIRLFDACGLVAVSTEPALDAEFATASGGEPGSYLVWGRKPQVSPRRSARRRDPCRRPLQQVGGRASRRAGCEPAR